MADAITNAAGVDNNIQRALDGLKEFLNEKVPKPTGWEKQWEEWGAMVVWILGWLSSVFLFLDFAEGRLNVNIKILGAVGVFVLWVALAVWIFKTNETKRLNAKAKRYKVFHGLPLKVFEAFGWLDESEYSMASRKLVTPAHIKAFSELLNDSEHQRRICEEGEGFEEFSLCYYLEHLLFLGLKNDWPFAERIALLCKKVKKTAEEYDAVLASVAAGPKLLAIAKALQDNSPSGLAPSATIHRDAVAHLVSLIDEDADGGVVMPPFNNGLTVNQTAAFVGQLQGIAEHMNKLHQSLTAQMKLD